MQQVLKSRAFLHNYAEMRATENMRRTSLDCGECDAPNMILPMQAEPKTWGLCEYRTKRELLTLRFMCWVALPACALAALYLNLSVG